MLLSLTAAYSIFFQLRKKIQQQRAIWKHGEKYSERKFTFDESTDVEPEGDVSLEVFRDWTDVLSLPTIKKKITSVKLY